MKEQCQENCACGTGQWALGSCCLQEPCKVAGNEVGNTLEGKYKDGMWFALSSLAKCSVNPGTESAIYLKRENFNNNLDLSGKPVTMQIFSAQ